MNAFQWIALCAFVVLGTVMLFERHTNWVKKSWKYIIAVAIPLLILILKPPKTPTTVPRLSVSLPPSTPATPPPAQAEAAPVPIPVPHIIIGLDYVLSPNFNYGMMTTTENRKLLDQNRQEGLKFIENLRRLCNEILEPIIILIGPTFITSAFRCPALNNSVGGAKNSQHTAAEAADTHYNIPLREAFNKIAFSSNISFGQLILEFEQWVHCSCTDSVLYPGKVSQKFIASRQDGKTIYTAVVSPI